MGYGDDLEPMMLGTIASVQPSFPRVGRADADDRRATTARTRSGTTTPAQDAVEGHERQRDRRARSRSRTGLIPIVDPSPRIQQELPQTGSDMAFLKERARANFFEHVRLLGSPLLPVPAPADGGAPRWSGARTCQLLAAPRARAPQSGTQVVRGYDEKIAEAVVGVATTADLSNRRPHRAARPGRPRHRARPRPPGDQRPPHEEPAAARGRDRGLVAGSAACGDVAPPGAHGRTVRGIGELHRHPRPARGPDDHDRRGRKALQRPVPAPQRHALAGRRRLPHALRGSQTRRDEPVPLLRKTLTELPPPNRQQQMLGLVPGKVIQNVDEEHGRVKVSYPLAGDDSESAGRAAPADGRLGTGVFFLPDKGDEVLVGFLRGQLEAGRPRRVWNGRQARRWTTARRERRARDQDRRTGSRSTRGRQRGDRARPQLRQHTHAQSQRRHRDRGQRRPRAQDRQRTSTSTRRTSTSRSRARWTSAPRATRSRPMIADDDVLRPRRDLSVVAQSAGRHPRDGRRRLDRGVASRDPRHAARRARDAPGLRLQPARLRSSRSTKHDQPRAPPRQGRPRAVGTADRAPGRGRAARRRQRRVLIDVAIRRARYAGRRDARRPLCPAEGCLRPSRRARSVPVPDLDDRSWADLADGARALIPRYAPQWTNHNPSDSASR